MISLFMLASQASGALQRPVAQFAAAPAAKIAVPAQETSSPDLLAVTPERRLSSRYVVPVQQTQWPYDSSISWGEGFNIKTETFASSAFEDYTGVIKSENNTLGVPYTSRVVKSMSEYHTAMEATARVKGKGWSVKAKAKASISREQSMSSKDVLFLLHTQTNGGFKGWENTDTPAFTERAKAALCKNGRFTPEEFERAYGTHYVQGYVYQSSLNVYVKIRTRTTSSDSKVSSSLEVAWRGAGKSVEGQASFTAQLKEEHSTSTVEIDAYAYGTKNNWVPQPDLDKLYKIVDEYEKNSAGGSPVALQLKRYNEHDDYTLIKESCAKDWRDEPIDQYWEDKLVNVVVEARLLFDEVDKADEEGDSCARNMRETAWDFFASLYDKEPPVSREAYYAARDRIDDLQAMWEECLIEAQPYLGGPNDSNARNLRACWGECDGDYQCAHGLKCFQRDGYLPIPGCRGRGTKDWDYCYDPSGSIELSGGNDDKAKNLQACTGDCDSDDQCASGLLCFQRDGYETIPGCTGQGQKGYDYCYDPNWGIPGPRLPILQSLGLTVTGLDICQGDCDGDHDCRGHLRCFQRAHGSNEAVPGCRGRGKEGWDYCYDPTGSIELSGGNDSNAWGLKACKGECDADWQCASGLLCFQRDDGETIPGCKGSGAAKDWDYCYDPLWQPANMSGRRLEAGFSSLPAPVPEI